MAKWNDGVITNAGISLLGEVIAGGEINITRAALGGGTVDEAALMAQTALTLPLTVSPVIAAKKLVEGKGIEIRIQIRNDGLAEDKVMKQVGLFAKLNSGDEVLFAVMQNESGEEIPSEASYKDFMLEFTAALAVSNTGSISVSINKLAVITKEALDDELKSYTSKADFNAHSGNAEIHVTADEKAAWNAVNYSNPNMLINHDFAINQRGGTSYSVNGYTVDRWKTSSSSKLTPNDGYVTFESTVDKSTPTIYQIVENPSALSGKTVTLSFDCDLKTEGAWISVQTVANDSWNPSSPVQFTNTGRSVKSTVINLPDNLTDLRVALVIHGTDDAPLAAVDIYGAKLELGEIATPIVPADPATELAKCQRYALKIVNGVQAVAYRILTNSISFYFPTTVTFRVNATSTADFAVQTGNSTEHSGFAFEFYTKPNGVIVEAKKTTHGITFGDSPILACKTQGIFDAEL